MYREGNRTWTAKDIGMTQRACAWMQHGFMSVDTDIGAGRAFLRSLYQQYAKWGVDFGNLTRLVASTISLFFSFATHVYIMRYVPDRILI